MAKKNRIYYLTKFEQFDQQPLGLIASWNWPAFFCGGVWAIYRKMYGWFFAFWGIATVSSVLEKAGSPGIGALVFFGPWIAFTVYANSLYHGRVKKKIAMAQLSIKDTPKLLEYLKYKGGVHTWVIWVFGLLPIIGILAAIIIPMLQPVPTPHSSSSKNPITRQSQSASSPSYESEGWTQESTGSTEVGPWLDYSPPGTRFCRYADRTIYRVYPPGVKPDAEKANPFCVGDSTLRFRGQTTVSEKGPTS
ncbi:MAG: DUF2628 domain-containing protein [Candidatus Accumulibacter phosphatis]|uniref:DUF2628 domain-containing protein n=1 Tax=Candidatus Accumulibacter contiguus TaxID=2954381 RepID=UPI002FC3CBCB